MTCMKMSISLPDVIGKEIKSIAQKRDRNISSIIKSAWLQTRDYFLSEQDLVKEKTSAMKTLSKLKGSLKTAYPKTTSIQLSKKAFLKS